MAKLTTAQRNALPDSAFAGPDRSYPVNDPSHARNALARVSGNGSPAEKAKVRAKVARRFPSIGESRAKAMRKKKGEEGAAHERGESKAFERAEET